MLDPKYPTETELEALRAAAQIKSYVSIGDRRTTSVHEFYRYPARFSPFFARRVIEAFSARGDSILDPFVGGGTTVVEAMLHGRRSIGGDLNKLAVFVTQAKTLLHTSESLQAVRQWGDCIDDIINIHRPRPPVESWHRGGYLRSIEDRDTWRITKGIAQARSSLDMIKDRTGQSLARLALLRTAQSVLDMRQEIPSIDEFRRRLVINVDAMCDVASDFAMSAQNAAGLGNPISRIINKGLPGLDGVLLRELDSKIKLVLTSPPYPGVYVLYHRWKVRGRKETPAPFWIVGAADGQGLAHYTMGGRADRSLNRYFFQLKMAFEALVKLADTNTWFVQLVGFNNVETQLPRYLSMLEEVGLSEHKFDALATGSDGRCWRSIPSRRWWVTATNHNTPATDTNREVVLVHRLKA